jgi:tRNA threonylcarbamoyladenosine dehydratase
MVQDIFGERYKRNEGFISREVQEFLATQRVAIAGCGGAGGNIALALAQLACTRFHLLDNGAFDESNINRQAGATYATIGNNKAEVVGKLITSMVAHAEVTVDINGVQSSALTELVSSNDIIIDALDIDPAVGRLSFALGAAASEAGKPVITGLEVGDGAQVTTFMKNSLGQLRGYYGNDDDSDILSQVSYIPEYVDEALVVGVASGDIEPPAITIGAQQLSVLILGQVLAYAEHVVLGDKASRKLYIYPDIFVVDQRAGYMGTVRRE